MPATYEGGFHAKVPASEPMADGKWHKSGNEQGNAAAPVFHGEVHSPGTAPEEDSFRPDAASVAAKSAAEGDEPVEGLDPMEGITTSTSKDVHQGLGVPSRQQDEKGLQKTPGKRDELKDPVHEKGVQKGGKGNDGAGEWVGAGEKEPVGAEELAAEMD